MTGFGHAWCREEVSERVDDVPKSRQTSRYLVLAPSSTIDLGNAKSIGCKSSEASTEGMSEWSTRIQTVMVQAPHTHLVGLTLFGAIVNVSGWIRASCDRACPFSDSVSYFRKGSPGTASAERSGFAWICTRWKGMKPRHTRKRGSWLVVAFPVPPIKIRSIAHPCSTAGKPRAVLNCSMVWVLSVLCEEDVMVRDDDNADKVKSCARARSRGRGMVTGNAANPAGEITHVPTAQIMDLD